MPQWKRYFILVYGAFETFVFTGNIFGWSSLLHMLRQEGIYDYVCHRPYTGSLVLLGGTRATAGGDRGFLPGGNDSAVFVMHARDKSVPAVTCAEQARILNLAYTIGSFCIGISAFLWGFLLDKWGLRIVRLIINGFITFGCVCLSLTVQKTSFLLFPSLILMCLAGVPLRLANMQFADLFPEQRSTIITTYSGAFTASASVFVFVKYGYDAGLPWEWACFMLVCLSIVMLAVTLFVLPADRIQEPLELFAPPADEMRAIAPTVWGSYTYNPGTPTVKKKSETSTNEEKSDRRGSSEQKSVTAAKSYSNEQQNIPKGEKDLGQQMSGSEQKRRNPKQETSEEGLSDSQKQPRKSTKQDSGPKLKHETTDSKSISNGWQAQQSSSNTEKSTEARPKGKIDLAKEDICELKEERFTLQEKQLPLTMSLSSFSFCMHQYWFCWLLLYTIIYVGTLHLWVDRTSGDLEDASWFSEVFGLAQVSGLFLAPLTGIFMDWNTKKAAQEPDPELQQRLLMQSNFWPIFLTTLMEAAAQVCKFFNVRAAIYVSIAAVTLLRAFFIAIGTAYVRIRFPSYHFNKMLGIMSTTSALVTLLQFPLYIWETSSTESILQTYLFEAVCLFIAFLHPVLLIITPFQEFLLKRERKDIQKYREN